jgi:hypothetical protein
VRLWQLSLVIYAAMAATPLALKAFGTLDLSGGRPSSQCASPPDEFARSVCREMGR